MYRRRLSIFGALFAFGMFASACGGGSTSSGTTEKSDGTDGTGAAAELEDELVVLCTVQEDWCLTATKKFEEETGVKTTYLSLSTGEAIARLESEGDNPTTSVWFGGPSLGAEAAFEKGLIEEFVPEGSADVINNFKSSTGVWTGIYLGALAFCSNVELLDELGVPAPTAWDDLLNPVFKKNMAMADQRTSGTAATAAANLVALRGSEDAALDYLKELHANEIIYTSSGSAPGRQVAQGEIATSVIFGHDCVKFEEEQGVDLDVTFPEEGTGYEVGQVSLIQNGEQPMAAKAFIEWALTAEAQELGAEVKSYQTPLNAEAVVPAQAISLKDITLAEGFTPQSAADLRKGDFPERFADEVRGGAEAPAEE